MNRTLLCLLFLVGCQEHPLTVGAKDMAAPFPSTCTSGTLDGDESDIDCGGSCAPCEAGRSCMGARDCVSGVCINKVCAAPACDDGFKNGAETDVDCGGSCPARCAEGKACNDGVDCASAVCINGVCGKPMCTNGRQDGQETDVDCGGPTCPKCIDGKMCSDGTDCMSGVCLNNTCAGCADGAKDGEETDVDCGGPTCQKCADGKACSLGGDCQSANCSNQLCCAAGFGHCGGNTCATSLLTDAKNCGSCGKVCPLNMPTCLDGKCKGKPTVLIVHSDMPALIKDVQLKVTGTGAFAAVDLFDAFAGTPTVAQLQPYDVVLVFSDGQPKDAVLLGDNLATYFDGGGAVVVAERCFNPGQLKGRFGNPANGYIFIESAAQDNSMSSLGAIKEPLSPLMKGVNSLTAQVAIRSPGATVNGGVVVAEWADKRPLIVRGTVKGRNRVDLNLYPVSADADANLLQGDGTAILRNALLYR